MPNPPLAAQLACEIAASQLVLAARQYAVVVDQVHAGDSTQAMLRARQGALEEAALVYATAHGWQVLGEPPS